MATNTIAVTYQFSMPSPANLRRSPNREPKTTLKSISLDLGKPLGPQDSNSVRERVRQWQAQGGGVVTAPDIYVEDDEVPSSSKSKPVRKAKKTASSKRAVETPKPDSSEPLHERKERKKNKAADEVEGEKKRRNRSRSAPPKRVISDAHWRKNRTPPQSPEPVTRRPKLSDDGIRVRAIGDEVSEESRRVPHIHNKERANDDGIRVFSTPKKVEKRHSPCRLSEEIRSLSGSENSDITALSRRSRSTLSDESKLERRGGARSKAKQVRFGSADTREEAKKRKPSQHNVVGVDESSKKLQRNLISHMLDGSKKLFSKPEPILIPVPRVPTIESWLDQTPDLFVDGDEPLVEMPAPLQPTVKKKAGSTKYVIPEDPNKIWEVLDSESTTRRSELGSQRQTKEWRPDICEVSIVTGNEHDDSNLLETPQRCVPAAKHSEVDQRASDISPSSLRRRGAKRDPTTQSGEKAKPSTPRKSTADIQSCSVVSSSDTASSVDPHDPFISLHSQGVNHRSRIFQTTARRRLSTIASVETFNPRAHEVSVPSVSGVPVTTEQENPISEGQDFASEARDRVDPNGLRRSKSRLTKHADLISILSMPKGVSSSIRSARSIRTNRSRLGTATIEDLMNELANDESKYMRELITLVDGVIPVLLSCVLSRSDAAAAAGLFSLTAAGTNGPGFTKPIIDMGIALERLKTTHKRIPMQDPDALLSWARRTQRIYSEYLKSWRMGFQDVVVNLAPATDQPSPIDSPVAKHDKLEGGLPRNADGDIINSAGERVDVAFLLKRPLVRLKYLAKTLAGINFVKPSTEAGLLATKYGDLVTEARKRANEERARLEDEAAAFVDATRARDFQTLAPLARTSIDSTRRVRARDCFDLGLQHSSAQRVDCRVELLLRDDAPGKGNSGDLLICEMDGTGRWLLFPPVVFEQVSARNGKLKGEIVVMVRSTDSHDSKWCELLSLITDDEQTGFEWVQMLGLTPVPPKISRTHSFAARRGAETTLSESSSLLSETLSSAAAATKRSAPNSRDIEIPIGERVPGLSEGRLKTPTKAQFLGLPSPVALGERTRLEKKNPVTPTSVDKEKYERPSDVDRTPRSLNDALRLAGKSGSELRRSTAKRHSNYADNYADRQKSPSSPQYSEELNSSSDRSATERYCTPTKNDKTGHRRSQSSIPSLDLPVIPKARKSSLPATSKKPYWSEPNLKDGLALNPTDSQKPSLEHLEVEEDVPPPPPIHRTPSPVQLKTSYTPDLSAKSFGVAKRRSSSPLKHEYEPSTASESSSDSDASTVERKDMTSPSDSSDDEELEGDDAPTPLLPLGALKRQPKESSKGSVYSLPNDTLTPSQSASQAPYKTVPIQENKAAKSIASIFYWSDSGAWLNLHPDECSISVTPGLIEAFEMSAAHSRPLASDADDDGSSIRSPSRGSADQIARPLVALELTPLVPIRRGTALDISIRSPPTSDSRITSVKNNNILFRSRNPEECEALYHLINQARINNPTYIALQNARLTSSGAALFGGATFDRSKSARGSSWFGFGFARRSSYRASSAPTPSVAITDSSIGSMSSAFSALKRFGQGGGGRFSISRSTVTSRTGSRATSVYTSSDQGSGSGTSTPGTSLVSEIKGGGAPIGLSNAKIRLYVRETATKWRDLGSARLTIMRPNTAGSVSATISVDSSSTAGGGVTEGVAAGSTPGAEIGTRQGANDKRVFIIGKAKGETLLDVTLGESCFERIARTGIAVSVWERFEGDMVAKQGGVVAGRLRVFMIQMKSEAETAYTFSIVGKLRY